MQGLERFAAETNGLPVARVENYVVYRVGGPPVPPLRPDPL
jgi:hypothetical protein